MEWITYAKAIRPAPVAALIVANDPRCHAWRKSDRDHAALKKYGHQFDFFIFHKLLEPAWHTSKSALLSHFGHNVYIMRQMATKVAGIIFW